MTTTNDKELRELDAWIAEHMMGLQEAEFLRDLIEGRFIRNQEGEILIWKPESRPKVHLWNPTSNPRDAMSVLKKCAEKAEKFIEIHNDDFMEGPWCVCTLDADFHEFAGYGPTLELAISRFAQKLFGG